MVEHLNKGSFVERWQWLLPGVFWKSELSGIFLRKNACFSFELEARRHTVKLTSLRHVRIGKTMIVLCATWNRLTTIVLCPTCTNQGGVIGHAISLFHWSFITSHHTLLAGSCNSVHPSCLAWVSLSGNAMHALGVSHMPLFCIKRQAGYFMIGWSQRSTAMLAWYIAF